MLRRLTDGGGGNRDDGDRLAARGEDLHPTYKKNLKDLAQLWIGTDGLPGD